MARICICQICNCGRHRCPPQPTSLYTKGSPVDVCSEYAKKYQAYKGHTRPANLKPQAQYKPLPDKMDGITTTMEDYVPYNVTRRPPRKPDEYKPIPGNMLFETTYNQCFVPHKVQPVVHSLPPQQTHTKNKKLDTQTSYNNDYRAWEASRRKLIKPDVKYQPPTTKFTHSTTSQEDFVYRGLSPRKCCKPPNVAKLSTAPFDGSTTYNLAYVPHAVEARYVRPPEKFKPNRKPFQDLTTHQQHYQGLKSEVPKSCKPEHTKVASGLPFQSNTEFSDSFLKWPVTPRKIKKSVEYTRPQGHMDLLTTTHADYVKHPFQPYIPAKGLIHSVRSSDPFQGTTTMRDAYQAWDQPREHLIRQRDEIQRTTGKTEYVTTSMAHYREHELQHTASFKPPNPPVQSRAPLQNETTYSSEFTPKKLSVCPAKFQPPCGFAFDHCDDQGHCFYCSEPSADQLVATD